MTSETADATAPVHPYYAPEPDSAWARVDRHDALLPSGQPLVTLANWQEEPHLHWSFQHMREVMPSQVILGHEAPLALPERPIELWEVPVSGLDWADTVDQEGVIATGRLLRDEVPLGPTQLVRVDQAVGATEVFVDRAGDARGRVQRVDDELVFGAAERHRVRLGEVSAFVDRGLGLVEHIGVVADAPVGQRASDLAVAMSTR